MFKDIQNILKKLFTRDRIIILVVLVILGYALYSYSDNKFTVRDQMETGSSKSSASTSQSSTLTTGGATPSSENRGGYTSQTVANPQDLLPNDQNSQWGTLNPGAVNPGSIAMPDLLQAGYHIGLDTIGQSLRNANLQLRSDPIIPPAAVGPWNQSTITPDYGRVPLEIGSSSA
jgi:hypothetical protein